MRGARAKPKAEFRFNLDKWSVPESGGASMVKKPPLDIRTDADQGGRKSAGGASTSSTQSRKKESHGDGLPDMLLSTTSLPLSLSVV